MTLYVILDIDETLIRYKETPVKGFESIKDKDYGYFILRPHLREFMKFLFKNHVVSLWTWNSHDYAMSFANIITDGNPKKFKDIMSAEDANIASRLNLEFNGKNLHHVWFDFNDLFKSEKAIEYMANREKLIEEREKLNKHKLNPDKIFFTDYKPCNTLLIDDAEYNAHEINKKNLIRIPAFRASNKKDTELLKIIEILKKVKIDCNTNAPIFGGRRKTKRHHRLSSK
jgi:hypothetical protein